MIFRRMRLNEAWVGLTILAVGLIMVGCSPGIETAVPITEEGEVLLVLPDLTAAELNGGPLKVVATTSIIGDVVAQVGGSSIQLTTLMGPGQDPHSFEPSARALTAVADADVIFVNGWDLEEALVHDLAEIGAGVPLVPISASIEPLAFGEAVHEDEAEEGEHEHSGADPHVWFSVANVQQWVENVQTVFSELDSANAAAYENNAIAYLAELTDLENYAETQLAQIPADRRFLVTNHDSFGYFAHEYDFTILGTVLPGSSTLAEPSASDLTGLIGAMSAHNLCTIFTESTASDALAQTAARELPNCKTVQILPLFTGAIGPAGSGTDSFVGMFRANVDVIVSGLTR